MDDIDRHDTHIRKVLTDAGMKIGLEQLVGQLALNHLTANEFDDSCTALKSPNGSVIKLGVKTPEGQSSSKSIYREVFVSVEYGDDGCRVHLRTDNERWYRREWGPSVRTLPREIHHEQALEAIKAMAVRFMAKP
jgi:hypothetical protein